MTKTYCDFCGRETTSVVGNSLMLHVGDVAKKSWEICSPCLKQKLDYPPPERKTVFGPRDPWYKESTDGN